MKRDFIIGQVLVNSINGAFQHAKVYVEKLKDTDSRKTALRADLRELLISLGAEYTKPVTEIQHCKNIQRLAGNLTNKYARQGLLRNDRFRIGIAQKALNLYLKYLWCLEEIPTPPHCPIDRQIVYALHIPGKERILYNWTKLDDIEKYSDLIAKCKQKAKDEGKASVADWELSEWEP